MEKLDLYKTCLIRKLVIDYLNNLDKGFLVESHLVNKICKISWISKEGKDGLVFIYEASENLEENKNIGDSIKFTGKYELIIDILNNRINFFYYPSFFEVDNEYGDNHIDYIDFPLLTVDAYAVSQNSIESSDDLDKIFYLLKYIDVWNKNNILKLEYKLLLKSRFSNEKIMKEYYWKWYLQKTFEISKNNGIKDINGFIKEFKKVIEFLLNNSLLIYEIGYLSLQTFWKEEFYEKIINGEFKKIIEKEHEGE